MRDFLRILQEHRYFDDARWNRSEFRYTFETGSAVEFFSADQPSKVRGPRRDRLFINEANNVEYETFDQLEVRTKEFVFIDWNPTGEFWFYDRVLGCRDDVDHLVLTYRDNEALPEEIVRSIEQRRNDARWWKVYGEGLLGDADGRIYSGWKVVDAVPHEARLVRRGVDFGYTNDPTAVCAVYRHDGGFILDEELYMKGLGNSDLAAVLKAAPSPAALAVCDSAEPKSVAELKLHGINAVPAEKGPDSVRIGIQSVQAQRVSITKRSVNGIREYRNYMWLSDRDGKLLNEPRPGMDHFLDAARYALSSLRAEDSMRPASVSVNAASSTAYRYGANRNAAVRSGAVS